MADDDAKAEQEVVLLEADARLIIRTIGQALQEHPPDSPTSDYGNYLEITGDLFRQQVEFSLNTSLLLQGGSFASAAVLARAAYERALDLIYLIKHGDKIRNALGYRARTLLEVVELFSDQPSGQEAAQILARMPEEIVNEQRQYRRARRGWSGLTIQEVAAAVGVEGHQQGYGLLSWFTHSRIAGYDVRREQVGEGFRLNFAEQVLPQHRHGLANFTRRFLHRASAAAAYDWLGRVPSLATTNPEESRKWR